MILKIILESRPLAHIPHPNVFPKFDFNAIPHKKIKKLFRSECHPLYVKANLDVSQHLQGYNPLICTSHGNNPPFCMPYFFFNNLLAKSIRFFPKYPHHVDNTVQFLSLILIISQVVVICSR